MKLIIGLGNPGQQYDGTRHNVGFRVVRAFHTMHADAFDGWKRDGNAEISSGRIGNEKVVLVLPQTFMNASGEAAKRLADFWKVGPEDVTVVSDDLDLPLGTLRIRPEGGAGGHNGLRSIIQHLGTEAFSRIRVGIAGERREDVPAEDYVLQRFEQTENAPIEDAIGRGARAIDTFLADGIEAAMNEYNA